MIISINGRLADEREAVISAYDHGFLYGLGLFETFRTYNGRAFLLEQHLARLHEGCALLGIPHQAEPEDVQAEIDRLLAVNGLQEAYIRYSVSAGKQDLGLAQTLPDQPTVVIYIKPLTIVNKWYETGRPIQLLRTIRPKPETTVRLKSFQYMNGWLAKRELAGYAWAHEAEGVQANERGELTEGIVSNIFFVRKDRLHTPSLAAGALPGITRSYVLRLAAHLGIPAEEGMYTFDDLLQAEEVFLTNSIQEIVPVCTIYDPDGRRTRLPSAVPGPITSALMRGYGDVV